MSLCGWASIDERGRASGGAAGDQTGAEVKVGQWYNFGQDVGLRFKDRELAKKAAQVMKAICLNDCVGYDQNQRTSLFTALRAVNWDVSKLNTKCECDCSSLIAVVLNAVGIPVNKDIYTGNMVNAIYATGYFEMLTDTKYFNSGKYALSGDIYVKAYHHTIMAIEDGDGASLDKKEVGYMFTVNDVSDGSKGNHVLLLQEILKARGYKGLNNTVLGLDGDCGANTVNAINAYQSDRRKHGVELGTNGKNDSVCGKKMWADLIAL